MEPAMPDGSQHATEIRCYIRDPDGYLIEVGQTILPGGGTWPALARCRSLRISIASCMAWLGMSGIS
jgi:hypothetical protein